MSIPGVSVSRVLEPPSARFFSTPSVDALLLSLARELGAPPVLAATAAAGLKVRSTRWPVAMGAGIALLLAGASGVERLQAR